MYNVIQEGHGLLPVPRRSLEASCQCAPQNWSPYGSCYFSHFEFRMIYRDTPAYIYRQQWAHPSHCTMLIHVWFMIAPVRQHPSRLHQVLPTAKRATKPLATDRRMCSQTLQSSTFRTGAMERSNIQYIQIYSDDIIYIYIYSSFITILLRKNGRMDDFIRWFDLFWSPESAGRLPLD